MELEGAIPEMIDEYNDDVDEYWEVSVRNKGHAKAEEVALDIPGARFARVRRQGRDPVDAAVREVVELGDLRPGEQIEIAVWADRPFTRAPSILQKAGKARLVRYQIVGPRLAGFGKAWEFVGPPLLFTIGALLLLFALTVLLNQGGAESESDPAPADSANVDGNG